jgi:cell division septum initiation protein DivIVA
MSDPIMNPDEVIAEIQKASRIYKAFAEADKIVSALQNAAQVERETLARLDATKTELEQSASLLVSANNDIALAKNEAKKLRTSANAKADELVTKAAADAQDIIDAANKEALDIDTEVVAASLELNKTLSAVDAAKGELDEVEAKLTNARKYLSNLAGNG